MDLSTSGDDDAKLVRVELLGKDLVEFCSHALEQMKIRGISEKDVLAVVRSPDEIGLPTQPNREHVRRFKRPTKAIDVIYEEREDRIIIITAYPKAFPRS